MSKLFSESGILLIIVMAPISLKMDLLILSKNLTLKIFFQNKMYELESSILHPLNLQNTN